MGDWILEDDDRLELAMKRLPYQPGERIGQFVVVQVPEIEVEETDTLSETERGTGGFGSSGK
jgi:dUTP pyrophosphatase